MIELEQSYTAGRKAISEECLISLIAPYNMTDRERAPPSHRKVDGADQTVQAAREEHDAILGAGLHRCIYRGSISSANELHLPNVGR
jgi:hypothetical protein